ncbi:MAG: M48 family metallopeptidase [Cryobacterium sp.]|nr:M48 family metallopeptidase [Oligoflexia bacterium]
MKSPLLFSLRNPGIIVVSTAVLFSCTSSPLGRRQLMVMPDSKMNEMGVQSFEEMKKATPIETNPEINAYVKCVALPITREAGDATGVSSWEIVVFKDKTANAFALPGGKIGVHTGMLPVAKTPGQLAAVLGHEVGHVIAKHGNERVSEGMITQGLASVAAISVKDPKYQSLVMAGLGIGAQYGIALPHSRTQESEADLIGLDLMARSGFDPRESVGLWQNMSAASGGNAPPQFLSTHPSNETRISALQSHIPEALTKYEAAQKAGKAPHCVKPAGL